MILNSVEIQNYRGIEHLNMEFNRGVNLIIGNNGAGKTSLLNALSVLLNYPLQWVRGVNQHIGIEDDVRLTKTVIGDAIRNYVPNYPVQITADVELKEKRYRYGVARKAEAEHDSDIGPDGIKLRNALKSCFESTETGLPLLCFFRADRDVIKKKDNGKLTINTGEVERVRGYQNAFSEHSDTDAVVQWCLQMEFTAFQRKQPIREYMTFCEIVNKFMSVMDSAATHPRVTYSSEQGTMVYDNGSTELPIYRLSAGFQSVLYIILELAYRAVILNPESRNLPETVDGVVLIDEIDIHLHPAWQWKILDALRETFPKVQFVIATHSPIILSSAKNAKLYLMKSSGDVEELDSVYGYQINDVLTLPQGTADMPKEISDYYDRAERYLDEGNAERLSDLVEEAEHRFQNEPAVLRSFKEFVDINRWAEEA